MYFTKELKLFNCTVTDSKKYAKHINELKNKSAILIIILLKVFYNNIYYFNMHFTDINFLNKILHKLTHFTAATKDNY